MFIVTYGNIVDGFFFVGPFESFEEARIFAEKLDDGWHIVELQAPSN